MNPQTVTCSFKVNRDLYNEYKSVVSRNGQYVKGNLVRHMIDVVNSYTPNSETIEAIKESERLINDKSAKTYSSFSEILEEIEDE